MGMIHVVGIDPGGETGLVCLAWREGAPLEAARFAGAAIVRPSTSTKLTVAEQKATLFRHVSEQLGEWQPTIVALEEPADGAAFFNSQGQKGQRRGTAFSLGQHYGLALAPARACSSVRTIASYPTGTHQGRIGWMQGWSTRRPARDETVARLELLARAIGASAQLGAHHLMALGVLAFHLQHGAGLAPARAPHRG